MNPSPIEQAEAILAAIRDGRPLDRTAVREALERLIDAARRP